jgi:frataxin
MTLDDAAFDTLADRALANLMDRIDAAMGDVLDIDMDGAVLTIELDSGPQYVINKHAPNRQIWLSSPVSGARHFDYTDDGEWRDTRGESELHALLAEELGAATGRTVELP